MLTTIFLIATSNPDTVTIVSSILGSLGIGGSTILYIKFQLKANTSSISRLYTKVDNHINGYHKDLDTKAALSDQKLDNIEKDVSEMKKDLRNFINKP
jgi:hypothetical protein